MTVAEALARLAPEFPAFEPGHVWLAGAGPGRLGCLTIEVVAALAAAEAVVYDALVDPAALRAAEGAALHFVGKRGGRPSTPQEEINALLVGLAREGRRVLRLKGGDPNVFGRGGDEARALARAGVPYRVLPGVTSAVAALAAAGIPATQRGVSRALILATGHGGGDDLDWAALARAGQPIVVYMGLGAIGGIAAALMAGGLPAATPAAVVASATCPEERVVVAELGSIAARVAEAGVRAPAVIVVGAIVALRDELRALAAAAAP